MENPPKNVLVKWIDKWNDALDSAGYSALKRGELPYELTKLVPRAPLPVGDPANPAIVSQNAAIAHDNEIKKAEKEARLLEYRNRLASKIKAAMRDKAPLRLNKLLAAHPAKKEDGVTIIADAYAYDGVAMWKELSALHSSEARRLDLVRRTRKRAHVCGIRVTWMAFLLFTDSVVVCVLDRAAVGAMAMENENDHNLRTCPARRRGVVLQRRLVRQCDCGGHRGDRGDHRDREHDCSMGRHQIDEVEGAWSAEAIFGVASTWQQ